MKATVATTTGSSGDVRDLVDTTDADNALDVPPTQPRLLEIALVRRE
jgi:hypothetical protein